MKLQAMAATVIAGVALVGGSAFAQATMQPIPNPPEKAKPMGHKHMKKHHAMKKAAATDSTPADSSTPAPK